MAPRPVGARGSTGFGDDFTAANIDCQGIDDLADITTGPPSACPFQSLESSALCCAHCATERASRRPSQGRRPTCCTMPAGIEALEGRGVVTPGVKCGIYGGSYGGYMSFAAASFSDRFAAAVQSHCKATAHQSRSLQCLETQWRHSNSQPA